MILSETLGPPPPRTGLARVSEIYGQRRGKAWAISPIAIYLYRPHASPHREILVP